MSSVAKGKRAERELCRQLRALDVGCERVRGSGGGGGTPRADVIFSSKVDASDETNRAVTDALKRGDIDSDDIRTAEVKAFSGSCYGAATLYSAHLEAALEDGAIAIWWDDGYLSSGVPAAALGFDKSEDSRIEKTPPKTSIDLLIDVDFAFLKRDGHPFICLTRQPS